MTLATASSKALFASSKAFSVSPHLSCKKTDIFRCKLTRTSLVGAKLLRAKVSAYS